MFDFTQSKQIFRVPCVHDKEQVCESTLHGSTGEVAGKPRHPRNANVLHVLVQSSLRKAPPFQIMFQGQIVARSQTPQM